MTAFTFSSYINAFTLAAGLKRLGIKLYTTDKQPYFPIPSAEGIADSIWLFFTEEASLRQGLQGTFRGRFLPTSFPIHLLDDKWHFAEWLQTKAGLIQGIDQWHIADIPSIRFPCLVKAKHSWYGQRKMPRGWICRTIDDLRHALLQIERERLPYEVFFVQEWLGDEACRVISVCGFHDTANHRRNLTAIVERVASHTTGLSCSAAVESIPDQWGLLYQASGILDELEFTGPYEMEFLVVGEQVRVLELNPRFWMQHAIFLFTGNGLIKRYLGLESEADRQQRSVENIVWIDGIHLISSLLHFRRDGFLLLFMAIERRLARRQQVVIFPGFFTAARSMWINGVWRPGERLLARLIRRASGLG